MRRILFIHINYKHAESFILSNFLISVENSVFGVYKNALRLREVHMID